MQTICRGDRSPYLGMFAQIKRVLLLIADILSIFSTCLQSISSAYCENCGSWFLQRTQITDHGSKKWYSRATHSGVWYEKNRLINILKNRKSSISDVSLQNMQKCVRPHWVQTLLLGWAGVWWESHDLIPTQELSTFTVSFGFLGQAL